jgi:ABC-type transport system involved in cytochrome bd biosynthesis fused ATPase/permease subunit
VKRLPIIALGWVQALALAGLYLCLGWGVDHLAADGSDGGSAALVALAAGAAIVVAGAAAWAVPYLAARGQAADEHDTRRAVVAHVFRLGAATRSRERTGALVSTATDGVERAAAYRSTFLGPMIGSMTAPLLVLVLAAVVVDPVWAAWLALALPAIPLALGGFQAAFRGVSRRYREAGRQFSAQFLDAIQGLGTLRLMNAEAAHGRRLAAAAESLRRHVMRLLAGNQVLLLVVDALFSLAFITAAAGLALHRLAAGAISGGQALALVLLGTLLLEPLDRIGQFFYVGMGGIASVKEIKALLATEPAIPDPGEGGTLEKEGPAVEFAGVGFAYLPGQPVLQDFDLRLEPGERVALTGPSGAGKTTIVELLQRNLVPTAGQVKVWGHDAAQVPAAWLRAQLAVVAQHTYLFTGTLRDNLLLAAPSATEDELWAALEAADLAAFVRDLPEGLDTAVGERGLALSGGQTQRLAIARAHLKDAPILVLDEPTAHVDLVSERAILAVLERLGQGRTVLAISHRQATIAQSGRVVEVAR